MRSSRPRSTGWSTRWTTAGSTTANGPRSDWRGRCSSRSSAASRRDGHLSRDHRPARADGSRGSPAVRTASTREFFLFCKRTETEPGLHGGSDAAVAGEYHPLAADSSANSIKPHPDRRHGSQIDGYIEIDVETGIDRTEIDAVPGIDDQPPGALRHGEFG